MSPIVSVQQKTFAKKFPFRPRRGRYLEPRPQAVPDAAFFEDFDVAYRALCAVLFNFVPTSGHPGGSASSGRIVAGLVFEHLDYDFSAPDAEHADQLCYAAGHKALGLYAFWALRNELVRIARPGLLPPPKRQLRFEDLLGFRRNPTQGTPLFRKLKAKALDGHPTPMTPFVPLATGASGVGVSTGLGFALGARDAYGPDAPRVHLLEGEGGMTPGRVHEALAAATSLGLDNAVLHVDWNQSSIDSDRVCAERGEPGDYVQWSPAELLHLHEWNVVFAGDGRDIARVLEAQRLALSLRTGQPTAVVYRTVKGWRYGIEGKKSHGAGHAFGSEGYFKALAEFESRFGARLPRFEPDPDETKIEKAYYDTLMAFRKAFEARPRFPKRAAERILAAKKRLKARRRRPRSGCPRLERLYSSKILALKTPPELKPAPGANATLRGALGDAFGYLNRKTGGALIGCAADLLGSTSVSKLAEGFGPGFFHSSRNPGARLAAIGGICEDAMGGMMAGLSSFGRHIGVSSSYAAFIAALEHIPARLHAIGQFARREATGEPVRTWIMVNAHAGLMTGEDGPTHADPQPLQLLQDNFPPGALITLTPWEPQEVWPLLIAGLAARPAVLCPFVPRPPVPVPDRRALGLPPASAAAQGVYAVRRAPGRATVVLQGCGVATVFINEVLPRLDEENIRVNVFYVASAELFDRLPERKRRSIFPAELADGAIGITDFTLPTLLRWVRSEEGIRRSLHPYRGGTFLGSGVWRNVFVEAGLDAPSQLRAVRDWVRKGARGGY
ncbi:MAG: hypothetical protein ABII00_18530 [Elusimicrobiota bacterium]